MLVISFVMLALRDNM